MKEPSFKTIYDNIDYMIENMTESDFIKNKIQKDIVENNVSFKPSFVSKELNQQNLLWEGF